MTDATIDLLRDARAAEKAQTLFYRGLAAMAEDAAASEDIEALNGLLADEQHHLSRLTVRLLELGIDAPPLDEATPTCEFGSWRALAQAREQAEIARYQRLLEEPLDDETAAIVRSILHVEQQHARNLGGKYTEA